MQKSTGSLTIKYQNLFYTLNFANNGWMAGDMVQYLEDIYTSQNPQVGILKLLGYTMQVSTEPPARAASHWVEIDLENHRLSTNSDFIRKSVRQRPPAVEDPYLPAALNNVYQLLDKLDFTVELLQG